VMKQSGEIRQYGDAGNCGFQATENLSPYNSEAAGSPSA